MAVISFAGSSSSFDTGALLESVISRQREGKIAPLENKLSALSDTDATLSSFAQKLNSLQQSY